MTKTAVREGLLARRNREPDRGSKSSVIQESLLHLPEFLQARRILTYLGVGSEVETAPLVKHLLTVGRPVAIPVVEGRVLGWMLLHSMDGLAPGRFGLLEPAAGLIPSDARISPSPGDCLVIPGVGFDHRGARIGYGGGYYDRVLDSYPDLAHVGLAFECQVVEELPVSSTDRPVRCLLTEKTCYRWPAGSTVEG